MPFTFSHPAIVLPFGYLPRRWFSLTGLIVGSMTPDFEYFLRMKTQSNYSHSIAGMFWFDLPLGILLAFVFHNIVRDALVGNLPSILKTRLLNFTRFHWNEYFRRNWLVVIGSVLIGTASHLFWDGFTHATGYFVQVIPGLGKTVVVLGFSIPIYKILQHLSTFLGAVVIFYTMLQLPKTSGLRTNPSLKYWIVVAMATVSVLVLRILFGLDWHRYGDVIVSLISGVFVGLLIAGTRIGNGYTR
jgi:Domain of unknown function (DUF4184)